MPDFYASIFLSILQEKISDLMLKDKLLKFLKLDGFIESLTAYVETRVELLKIEVKEEIVNILIKATLALIVAFSFLFFLLFISVAMAFWLGKSIGMVGSFSVVAGIYLLLMFILLLSRESISDKLKKKLTEDTTKKK